MKQFLQALLFVLISLAAVSQNPLPVTNVDPFAGGLKINLTGPYSYGQNVVSIGNTIFFVGGDNEYGQALWKYNTTTREYALIKDVYPGPGTGTITSLVALNNKVYFAASADLTTNMFDIYMSDGTEAGTVLLFASTATEKSGPFLLKAGSFIYFATQISGQPDSYLYSINGSTVTQLKNISYAGFYFAISPYSSASYGGYLFFMGYDDAHGSELWRSDGTAAGTELYADLSYNPPGGAIFSNFYDFIEVNNQLFFTGLYTTLENTSGIPDDFHEVGHSGLLKITSPSSAPQLFYDYNPPTNGGTHIQASFYSYAQQNGPAVLNGVLYFAGGTVSSGQSIPPYGLCRTDGTAAGTYMVKEFAGGVMAEMSKFNDKIIFEAFEGQNSLSFAVCSAVVLKIILKSVPGKML
jgi:ELWxxDGT repeat protein